MVEPTSHDDAKLAKFQQFVDRVDMFHGLDPRDVQKIYSKGTTMRVQKGDAIFYKGSEGNQMFVILGGAIGIYDGKKLLSKLSIGDTFGEMSLLMSVPRTATAMAVESSHLLAITEDVFEKLMTKRVAVRVLLNLSRVLGQRLEAANKRTRDVEGR